MKRIVLIFLIWIIFTNCKGVENQQIVKSNAETDSNLAKVAETPPTETPLPVLSEEQKKILDRKIPSKIREILDTADEIEIYYSADKETKELKVLFGTVPPNSIAKISDVSLKKRFLDAFYFDSSSNEMGLACFSPRHRLMAKRSNKTVELDICYECDNYKGKSSFGNFGGNLTDENKSSSIINEIIEKYGTQLQ